jgi:hypothetical protein
MGIGWRKKKFLISGRNSGDLTLKAVKLLAGQFKFTAAKLERLSLVNLTNI